MSSILPLPPDPLGNGGAYNTLGQYGLQSGIVLPEVNGLWFNNQDVYLDGWKFTSCRFDNCRLYVDTSNFIINGCFIDESNSVHYHGSSIKTIQIYNRTSDWIRANYPHFAARKNSDGTFSIGG